MNFRDLFLSLEGNPRGSVEVVWVDPDRLSGAPCFRVTRIPVQMLMDHLRAGFSLDEFLETVPSLERAQAQRFLELAGEQMLQELLVSPGTVERAAAAQVRMEASLVTHGGFFAGLRGVEQRSGSDATTGGSS